MPKTGVIPFSYETYTCSCGWTKLGDKRSISLGIKLHNKQNHAGIEILQTTWIETERKTKSEIHNENFTPKVKVHNPNLML
jgi:hypothetical protein